MQLPLPFTLKLGPSLRLTILLAVMHVAALAALILVSLPLWIKFVLLATILVSAWGHLTSLRGPRNIASLTLRSDGWLEFTRQDGSIGVARIHPHTTVTMLMTVLLLHLEGRIEALVILPDAIGRENFRLLRLWLRWCAAGK